MFCFVVFGFGLGSGSGLNEGTYVSCEVAVGSFVGLLIMVWYIPTLTFLVRGFVFSRSRFGGVGFEVCWFRGCGLHS